jgi:hypothetical protein
LPPTSKYSKRKQTKKAAKEAKKLAKKAEKAAKKARKNAKKDAALGMYRYGQPVAPRETIVTDKRSP